MKLTAGILVLATAASAQWTRHTIDNTSRGADGVRLADVNRDGRPDIATGWEQGGSVRVYFNPGPARAKQPWPKVIVGTPGSPEDAVFADLDGDGALDVVSSCEGEQRAMFVHWAPKDRSRYSDSSAWKTEMLPATADRMKWMFAAPLDIDGKHGIDLIAGGRNEGAELGWFQAPANPRELKSWRWHLLRKAGWIMSIEPTDMDGDGDKDILISDRKERVFWLENPGAAAVEGTWREHEIGPRDPDVMFLTVADLDRDGLEDVIAAVQPRNLRFHRRKDRTGRNWETFTIRTPEFAGTVKAVRAGDINSDGKTDLVFTCEHANVDKPGVLWLEYGKSPTEADWRVHDISGGPGLKYDLIELIDLDGDGDLDVLTCEETDNLGVVWYENPLKL